MIEQTFFITANAYMKRHILQSDRMASLLIDVLYQYRAQSKFLLHDFVVMPNHLHAILSPAEAMTKVAQLIKGGFSYRAKKEVGYPHNVWQPGFHEHRIRDFNEYCAYKKYVVFNPVKRGLSSDPVDFRYGSASGMYELDRLPQRLNRSLSGGLATPR